MLDEPGSSLFTLDQFYGLASQEWNLTLAPAGVDIHGQPSNAVAGQPISPAITVAVVDAKGNTITTNNTQLVTLAIASGPAGAKLLGTTTVRAVNGVADFTNLSLSLARDLHPDRHRRRADAGFLQRVHHRARHRGKPRHDSPRVGA